MRWFLFFSYGWPQMNVNRKGKNVFGGLVFLVSILVYLTAVPNGFVHDDHFYVERNELIREFSNLPKILFSSSWSVAEGEGVGQYYRPISHFIYTLIYVVARMILEVLYVILDPRVRYG